MDIGPKVHHPQYHFVSLGILSIGYWILVRIVVSSGTVWSFQESFVVLDEVSLCVITTVLLICSIRGRRRGLNSTDRKFSSCVYQTRDLRKRLSALGKYSRIDATGQPGKLAIHARSNPSEEAPH